MAKAKKVIKKKKKSLYERSVQRVLSYEADLRLILIPLILLVILQTIGILVSRLQVAATQQQLAAQSSESTATPYTFFTQPINPGITAESAIIMDLDSKNILFEKNANLRFSMASTTKLMTALVALDYYHSQDILTAYSSNVEGVNVGVELGDKMYFRDALFAMLLPSGNDIALMMAQNYPGGQQEFMRKMNEKTLQLHLHNTHYADPAGLNDDGNYTTATELAYIAGEVAKSPTLTDITATKSKIITTVDGSKTFTLLNLNKLLGVYGVTGMKTGHTEGAGDVLISSSVMNGHEYIIIVMKSLDRFSDTQILLSYLSTGVTTFTPKSFVKE